MIKTCVNCKSYHGILEDPNTDFHFHDYCSTFKAIIPDSIIFDREDCAVGFHDIECGLAVCWGFEPREGDLQEVFPKMDDNLKWLDNDKIDFY